MAITKTELTIVELKQNYKVFYEERNLFGLVSWRVKVYEIKIGKDLIINTSEEYDNIIVNGKRININGKSN